MERTVTNETPLSFLTVGEFKGLIDSLLKDGIDRVLSKVDSMETDKKNDFPDTFGKKECSVITGYSINTINRMICEKGIPYYKRGGKVLFARAEIMEWMLKNKVDTVEEIIVRRSNNFARKS